MTFEKVLPDIKAGQPHHRRDAWTCRWLVVIDNQFYLILMSTGYYRIPYTPSQEDLLATDWDYEDHRLFQNVDIANIDIF